MTDDLHRSLTGGRPFYRRVRKHKGETWKPDQRKKPNTDLGIWCSHCRSVHPWRNQRTLATSYEKYNGVWYVLWVCARTGNVLKREGINNGLR